MLTLEELQACGAIEESFKTIAFEGVDYEPLSSVESMTKEARGSYKGKVLVDNPVWVATLRGKPYTAARKVISCDGEYVGVHSMKNGQFMLKRFNNSTLETIKLINDLWATARGGNSMENFDKALENMDLDGLLNDGGAPAPAETPVNGEKKEKTPSEAAIRTDKVRSLVQQSGITLADRSDIIVFNRKYGRVFGFVCKTDKVIKVAKTKEVVKVNGEPVLVDNISDADQQLIAKKDKNAIRRNSKKRSVLTFREVKPTTPMAVIIGTPIGGDVELTRLGQKEPLMADRDKTDLVFHVLPTETAYVYVLGLYDGEIMEDDSIIGTKACKLTVKSTVAKPKQNSKTDAPTVRHSFTVDRDVRKTLLTEGNYIAVREYETIPVSSIETEEQAKALNLNLQAIINSVKEEADKQEMIAKDGHIKVGADGTVTSDYFKVGGGDANIFPKIAKFTDKDSVVSSISIPVRVEKKTKNDKITIAFSYNEDTFKTNKTAQTILNRIGMDNDKFKSIIEKVSHRRTGSGKKAQLSNSEALAIEFGNSNGSLNGAVTTDSKMSFKDMALFIEGLA